ncbi:MAG: tetratricopeptide repeat protein [Clostridia bacterium]|nr:tetratricopeptide repeat protein [Clostridia bacterium]
MTHKIRAARGGKVLSFEQNGEFYLRSGMTKLDKNDLLGAMASYRTALEKDPENPEVILAIAEILTAMQRYDESNRLLMSVFSTDERPGTAFFGMGCNFMAQREYEQARMSFDKYLELEPDGEFAYSAYDMAEAIDDGSAQSFGGEQDIIRERAELARRMMEQEDFSGAIESLEKLVEEQPERTLPRNYLALAYYCVRDYDRATEQVGEVLRRDPSDIQAHCNLAVFMRGARDDLGLKRQVEYLKSLHPEDIDELNHLGVTLMEVREFEAALPIFKKIQQSRPYEAGVLHRLALCHYFTEDYSAAVKLYDKLLQIDKQDSIAAYYRRACRSAERGEKRQMGLVLNYQVPPEEIVQRIRRLNDYIHSPREELAKLWHRGSELQTLAKWGLTLPDVSVKRAMLSFIASFSDRAAEEILRDFALQRQHGIDIKRDAFALLKNMGAKEPYLSYVNGELMESRVSLVPVLPKDMPRAYGEILESCLTYMRGIRDNDCMAAAVKLWTAYVEGLTGYRPLSRGQVLGLAAAIEYAACRKQGIEVTKWELCSKYGISVTRFNNALAKLGRQEEEK